MSPEAIAAIVAQAVAEALKGQESGVQVVADESKPAARSGSRKRSRKAAKTTAARKPRAKGRKPFTPNPDWAGQEPSPRMLNTCARLYADGHISKADYTRASGDKLAASEVIGKGFAKAGIAR